MTRKPPLSPRAPGIADRENGLARRFAILLERRDRFGGHRFSERDVQGFFLLLFSIAGVDDPEALPPALRTRLVETLAAARRRGARTPEEVQIAVLSLLGVPRELLDELNEILREHGVSRSRDAAARYFDLLPIREARHKEPPVPVSRRRSVVSIRAESGSRQGERG